jgi:DNA-binding transcriptional MerR regulator
MSYSTKEVTEKLKLSMHTLRYYEKEGLLLPIERDKNGAREYSDLDLEWFVLIRCMRAAGMSISYIKNYMDLCKEGLSSVSKRKEIILLQKKILEDQKKQLDENLEVVNWKLKYYQELEGKEPEESADIIAKAHATAFERMAKLLDKKE